MKIAKSRRRPIAIALAVAAALVLGIVIGFVIDRGIPGSPSARPPTQSSSTTSTSVTTKSSPTLSVVSVSPLPGAVDIGSTSPITVTFSSALAANSPTPSLEPPGSGSWHLSGTTATFTPAQPFLPLSGLTLSIPAGATGVRSAAGGVLSTDVADHYRVANGSVVRLQQLLSLLGYSPLVWTPSGTPIAAGDLAAQTAALYTPPAGTFTWRNRGWPGRLRALWVPGSDNVFTEGLIMSFQADHGLDPNGHIGPALWATLISALGSGTVNTGGYNYALADKTNPERFTVWHDGRVVVSGPANTGIAGSPTPDGTFPVFTRLRSQVMRGTNPSGAKYADLVQYIAYFHGNDAVHYMPRADYGIPQSLGCVELPLTEAASAWRYLAYGTLVTVIG